MGRGVFGHFLGFFSGRVWISFQVPRRAFFSIPPTNKADLTSAPHPSPTRRLRTRGPVPAPPRLLASPPRHRVWPPARRVCPPAHMLVRSALQYTQPTAVHFGHKARDKHLSTERQLHKAV